jgi:hypothetical protein
MSSGYVPEWVRLGITPIKQNPLADQNIGVNPYSNLEQELALGKKRTLEEAMTEDVEPILDPNEEMNDNNDVVSVEEHSGIHISVGQFAVVFRGDLVFTGEFDEVEIFVTSLIMGETELTSGQIDPDEVMVLKRIQIKSGIFISE